MKKFLVVAFVLAAVCISTAAYAIDVTVNGEADVRGRLFVNIAGSPQPNHTKPNDTQAYTETRYMVTVNVKGDGVKGKLSIWNEHDMWEGRGTLDTSAGRADGTSNVGITGSTSSVYIREAWLDFMIPGTPVGVKVGQMLGQIGQGWFLRSNWGGHQAWVVYANIGKVATISLQDIKINEGLENRSSDEADLYSVIAVVKPTDGVTVGLDVSYLRDNDGTVLGRTINNVYTVGGAPGVNGAGWLWNFGMNYNVKAGPATIKGEFDVQSGHTQTNAAGGVDYDGFQGIIQANVAAGPATVKLGAAYGSGNRTNVNTASPNNHAIVTMLDAPQHYSYIYEYRLRGASNVRNTGLVNTWFLTAGVDVKPTKTLTIGADVYYLQAVEWARLNGGTNSAGGNLYSKDLGLETDLKLTWKIYPNVTYTLVGAWLSTGGAYRASAANGGAMSDAYAVESRIALTF